MRPPGHLDLEAIAAGVRLAKADRLQQLAAPRLEAAGQVAVRQQQHDPGEGGARPADQLPVQRPADRAAALDVAAAQMRSASRISGRSRRGRSAGSWLKSASICTPPACRADPAPSGSRAGAAPRPSLPRGAKRAAVAAGRPSCRRAIRCRRASCRPRSAARPPAVRTRIASPIAPGSRSRCRSGSRPDAAPGGQPNGGACRPGGVALAHRSTVPGLRPGAREARQGGGDRPAAMADAVLLISGSSAVVWPPGSRKIGS